MSVSMEVEIKIDLSGWQKLAAFRRGQNGHKNFRQACVYYLRDICVIFARNCKFAYFTQYNMQYIPCNSALLERIFLLSMMQNCPNFIMNIWCHIFCQIFEKLLAKNVKGGLTSMKFVV